MKRYIFILIILIGMQGSALAGQLIYSTYLGGSDDYGECIAVDTAGNAYIAGYTA